MTLEEMISSYVNDGVQFLITNQTPNFGKIGNKDIRVDVSFEGYRGGAISSDLTEAVKMALKKGGFINDA